MRVVRNRVCCVVAPAGGRWEDESRGDYPLVACGVFVVDVTRPGDMWLLAVHDVFKVA